VPLFKRAARFSPIKASDVMSSPAVTTREDVVEEVARLMWENGVGSILVTNRENKLVGIITERDILSAVSHHLVGKNVQARSLMSRNLVTASPDEELSSVIEKMRDFNIRHIPVVDNEGHPLGVILIRDIIDVGMKFLSLFVKSV